MKSRSFNSSFTNDTDTLGTTFSFSLLADFFIPTYLINKGFIISLPFFVEITILLSPIDAI